MAISTTKRERTAGAAIAESPAALTPAIFHILLALADGESHGYGIMQDIEQLTGGETKLGPGTLYRSIQRMLVDGLIEERSMSLHDEEDDDRRRYYRLTKKGFAAAKAEAQRLQTLVELARQRKLLSRSSRRG